MTSARDALLLAKALKSYQKLYERRQHDIGRSSGNSTLKDRVASYALAINDDPKGSLASVDALLGMIRKKGKRESTMAVDTLAGLWIDTLLPSDRKLTAIHANGIDADATAPSALADAYYEHQLKQLFSDYVGALESMTMDPIEKLRQKAIAISYQLLAEKPEQEQRLLSIIVNKMGDNERRLASNAMFYLNKLVERHPVMKAVVIDEVEHLLYRPNVTPKAKYYALCFLSQVPLGDEDADVATKLLAVYLSLFSTLTAAPSSTGVKNELQPNTPKMLSSLLTGVNRAFPYASDTSSIEKQIDVLFRLVHVSSFPTATQVLMLLQQMCGDEYAPDGIRNRFYSALYRKLLDPAGLLMHEGHCSQFLNVLYKTLLRDSDQNRLRAFTKRILQLCGNASPHVACALLVLLSEAAKKQPSILTQSKLAPAQTAIGITSSAEVDDSVEASSSWFHKAIKDAHLGNDAESTKKATRIVYQYDSSSRNPQFSGAEYERYWELSTLVNHYHPSVAAMAQSLLDGAPLAEYASNPLEDFTLIKFLDRFVYRNPKAKRDGGTAGVKRGRKATVARRLDPLSDEYAALIDSAVPPEERFLHSFLKKRAAKRAKTTSAADDDNVSEVADEEFDKYLEKFELGRGDVDVDDDLDDVDFAEEVATAARDEGADFDDELLAESDDDELLGAFADDMPSGDEAAADVNSMPLDEELESDIGPSADDSESDDAAAQPRRGRPTTSANARSKRPRQVVQKQKRGGVGGAKQGRQARNKKRASGSRSILRR